MIRTSLPAAVVAVVLVLALDGGHGDPASRLAAEQLVTERRERALAALESVRSAIGPGLEAARRGAARTVGGDGPPGPAFEEAATLLGEAVEEAVAVREALAAYDGAVLARDPDAAPVGQPIPSGEIASIGAQLEAVAPAADAFADQRERAGELVETLEDALAALDDGSLDEAAALAESARTDHAALLAWEVDLVTLPVWLDTTDAMITAVEDLVAATRAGDAVRALAAADDFVALSEEAAPADRALRIAIGEGGSSIAAAPLERLATLLREIEAARAHVVAGP